MPASAQVNLQLVTLAVLSSVTLWTVTNDLVPDRSPPTNALAPQRFVQSASLHSIASAFVALADVAAAPAADKLSN